MNLTKFDIIVAKTKDNLIGENDKLPWDRISNDMKYFYKKTQNCVLIVGRKTFFTLPKLPNRNIIVVTSGSNCYEKGAIEFKTFESALNYASCLEMPIYVIGGGELYRTAITSPYCRLIDITEISHIDGIEITNSKESKELTKVYFPSIPTNYKLISENEPILEGDYIITRKIYENQFRPDSEETKYLQALENIIITGNYKLDRTSTGTISSFGETLTFNFTKGMDGYYTYPLLTTKKMFFKGIVEELLFFLRGQVDSNILKTKGINIWNGNTTREFLDSRGLTSYEEGSMGKAYGFQWRHWGAPWLGKNANYKTDPRAAERIDQIANVIHLLKTDPNSRRIVLSAWNVGDLDEMCLPPCHMLYVFNVQKVKGEDRLFCHLTQRSGDMFLGIPFNIASASLLVFIIAAATNLVPGGLMMSIVDAHIYSTHLEQCKVQLDRTPYHFPFLKITKSVSCIEDIELLELKDISLIEYTFHPPLNAKMAI